MSTVEGLICLVERIYKEPKVDDNVLVESDEAARAGLEAVNQSLKKLVNEKRAELGVQDIAPINLPSAMPLRGALIRLSTGSLAFTLNL